MNFLAPAAFFFAAAIPVVILFYLLKRKRVLKLVSSTLLWQRFLADTQANAPFQRLRHNWLLLLQILLLALVVFALSRPYFAGKVKNAQLRVVVLDASASMQATDEKPSRFEKARSEALKWVNGLQDDERMMILLAGASTEVKQSPTSDKAALRRALQSCAVSDGPTRLTEALKTAGAFTYEKRGEEEVTSGEIHLFSDGAVAALTEFENKNLPLVYHRIGESGNNAGIVSLDVRANPEDPAQRAIFTSIANFSTNAVRTEIELLFDNQTVEVRPLNLAATNTQPQVFVVPQTRDGVFTLRLKAQDELAADNQASIVSLMPTPVRTLLVTRGNHILEKALRAQPNVQLIVAPALTDPASTFDVVVLDDVTPMVWPAVNTFALHTASTNWFGQWTTVSAPIIVDWKHSHPLLRFVSFDNVAIAEALAARTPSWGISLLDAAGEVPLIVAGEIEHRRIVWVAFDPLQSTWPYRISFPIFMVNAMEWLNPASANSSALLVRAGEAFRLGVPDKTTSVQITKPNGNTTTLEVEPRAREVVFGDTFQQGIYRLKAGTNETTFCVDLLDSMESNILPREELPLGRYSKVTASTVKRANMEWWRWIASAGLLVLLFEWWYYHRRTV